MTENGERPRPLRTRESRETETGAGRRTGRVAQRRASAFADLRVSGACPARPHRCATPSRCIPMHRSRPAIIRASPSRSPKPTRSSTVPAQRVASLRLRPLPTCEAVLLRRPAAKRNPAWRGLKDQGPVRQRDGAGASSTLWRPASPVDVSGQELPARDRFSGRAAAGTASSGRAARARTGRHGRSMSAPADRKPSTSAANDGQRQTEESAPMSRARWSDTPSR